MSDPVSIAGQVAGPLGYMVAQAVTKEMSGFGMEQEEPFMMKMVNDLTRMVKPFGVDGEDVEDAVEKTEKALERAGTGADIVDDHGASTKGYSVLDWIVFGFTILAIILSWTLNNDVNVRAKLGFKDAALSAGIFMSLLNILFIFMFGPWVYFAFLLIPLIQYVSDTPSRRYWIEGVKDVVADPSIPDRDKFLVKYLGMLPQLMNSGVAVLPNPTAAAAAAKFGHFYY